MSGMPPATMTFARNSTSFGAAQTLCHHCVCARWTVATRGASLWVNCVPPPSMAVAPLWADAVYFVIFVGALPTKQGKAWAMRVASIIA